MKVTIEIPAETAERLNLVIKVEGKTAEELILQALDRDLMVTMPAWYAALKGLNKLTFTAGTY